MDDIMCDECHEVPAEFCTPRGWLCYSCKSKPAQKEGSGEKLGKRRYDE